MNSKLLNKQSGETLIEYDDNPIIKDVMYGKKVIIRPSIISPYSQNQSVNHIVDCNFNHKLIDTYREIPNMSYTFKDDTKIYHKTIMIGADNYHLYFTDMAIIKFANIIEKLNQRRIDDTFIKAKNIIQSGNVKKLEINITNNAFKSNNIKLFSFNGILRYDIFKDESVDINAREHQNIKDLIDIFAQTYGDIVYISSNDGETNGYNNSQISVYGDTSISEKIFKLKK